MDLSFIDEIFKTGHSDCTIAHIDCKRSDGSSCNCEDDELANVYFFNRRKEFYAVDEQNSCY